MAGMKTYLFLLIFLISSAKSLSQHVIYFPPDNVCYNDTYNLKIASPVAGASFEWQYTLYTILWEDNSSRFQSFNNDVMSYMSAQPQPESDFSMDHISKAVYSTDYTCMKMYFDLYLNPTQNKYQIAGLLFGCITDQQSVNLTQNEYNFLGSYYYSGAVEALLVGSEIMAPYIRHDLTAWTDLGTSNLSDGSINFCPETLKLDFKDLTKLGLRVRQSSPVTTSYSEVKNVMLKPKPALFDVSWDKSCSSMATANIRISNINGFSEYLYRYYVKKPDGAGWQDTLSITKPEINTTFPAGDYRVSVYYRKTDITGCSYDKNIHIDTYAKPAADISTKDATCPGKPDGQISVTVKQNGLNCAITLDGQTIENATTLSNLFSGTHIINLSDRCETVPIEKKIGEPAQVSFTAVKTEPTCLTAPNGSILVNATGGTGTFDFEILNSQETKTFASISGKTGEWQVLSLAGGTYMLKARSGGCPWVKSEQSLEPVQPITFTTVVKDVGCFGESTGIITVNAAGGKNPYSYSLDNQNYISEKEFGNLYEGTYLVKVQTATESCNDVASQNIIVGSAPEIAIGLTPVSAKCFDNADGAITATVTGGTGAYSFSWDYKDGTSWYPAGGNTESLSRLIAGTYRLNVADILGCRQTKETIVDQPSALMVSSAVPKDVICYGTDGSISVAAAGGTGAYKYFCTSGDGNSYENTSQIITVPAGSYFVKVKDSNGCEDVFNDYTEVTVTGPGSPLDFSANISDYNGFSLSCKNDASGRVTLLATGGNGAGYNGYIYSLKGSAFQAGNIYDGLAAGSYIAKIQDGRGCSVQKTINLTEPDALSLNLASVTPVKCFGAPTGEISAATAGGIQNTYMYRLNGKDMPSSGIFRNLYAGTYNIEVSDLNGCRQNLDVTVQSLNPPIKSVITGTDIKCFGEQNGSIKALVTGGSGSFSYQWEKKSNTVWQSIAGTGSILENLLPGNYRIRITDSEVCSSLDSTILKEPSKLLINNLLTKDAVCFGESGNIQIAASGGTPGYVYLINLTDGSDTESQIPMVDVFPGRYQARVKDINGCVAIYNNEVIIDGPTAPLGFMSAVSSFNGYAISCRNGSNGTITLTASGGNGGSYSGYTYALGNPESSAVNSFTGLTAGVYTAKVTDGRGCIVQKAITLNEPQSLGLSLLHSFPVKCQGTAGGEIAVMAEGGIPDSYIYRLNGKDQSSSGIFRNLFTGNYAIEVTDGNGCTQNLSSAVVYKNPPLKTTLSANDVSCYGNNNGKILAEVTGGAGSFSYQWEKRSTSGWQALTGNTGYLQSLSPGFYRLKASDSDNCMITDSAAVTQPDPLIISDIKIKDAVCYGDSGSLQINASGGNQGYAFQYSLSEGATYQNYIPGQPLRPASYRIKVTDAKNCESIREEPVTITRPDLALNFTYAIKDYNGYSVSCHGNTDGELTVIPSGGNGSGYSGYTYQLSGKEAQGESLFRGLVAGIYDVTVLDGRGCSITHQATLNQPVSAIAFNVLSLKNPVCIKDSNGEIVLAASGGSEPYSWSLDNGEFLNSGRFGNLRVGNYSFMVRDANGCGDQLDTTLMNTIEEMTIAGMVSDVKCFGGNTGTINLLVSGGAKPYSYYWNDNPSLTSVAGNLTKGEHLVYIKDSAGCKSEKTFYVGEPLSALSVTSSALPACVSLQNGEIQVLSSGGTAPYRFAVDRQADFSQSATFKVFSGKHTAYVADKNDCISSTLINVGTKNVLPDQNFMLATSRYELDTLVLVDVSVPAPDKVKWEFPPEAIVVDTSSTKARVSFRSTGIWPVKMTGYFGECIYTIEKLLNIAPFDPLLKEQDNLHKGIKSVKISPNPNDGHFELKVELYTKQQVSIRIMDYYSRLIFNEKYPADIEFNKEIILPEEILPGTYFIWITGENDARSEVLIISE